MKLRGGEGERRAWNGGNDGYSKTTHQSVDGDIMEKNITINCKKTKTAFVLFMGNHDYVYDYFNGIKNA